ncbi:hypothetical protein [Listeria booriae]|uniref:Uncharacterized protein n=1 Tax=Listeria booriae TaxID=1552123 RepID=A0A7X0WDA4_9LIST|nr:hypothetical protein [Listeria booriae]MBC1331051.1 hypothetical protein [Listeria booriae]MBC2386361.1 hypothetical protein [Listeria booriae]
MAYHTIPIEVIGLEVTKEKVERLEREFDALKQRVESIEHRNHEKDLDEKEAIHEIKRSLQALESDLKTALAQARLREDAALQREDIAISAAEKSSKGFYWSIGLIAVLLMASLVRGFLG